MLRITFHDGSTMHIAEGATVITNVGPMVAASVTVGTYVRCGAKVFCRVEDVVTV